MSSSRNTLHFGVITLFPSMLDALHDGIIGRAIKQGILNIQHWNPRTYSKNSYGRVDDRPYGGGPGMIMQFQPLYEAVQAAKKALGSNAKVIYLSPQGHLLTQQMLNTHFKPLNNPIILIAGRYKGIDQRFIEHCVDEEWSIGDYIISGGELAAMVLIDAISRLHPHVLGNEAAALDDSFMTGLLDHPHYTKPQNIAGYQVPKVLTTGNHAHIAHWRLQQRLAKTWQMHKDLIKRESLNQKQRNLLLLKLTHKHAAGTANEDTDEHHNPNH